MSSTSQPNATPSTPPKYYGVTAPISWAKPDPADLARNAQLVKHLQDTGMFESDKESVQRELVLGKLNQLVKQFIREVGEATWATRQPAWRGGWEDLYLRILPARGPRQGHRHRHPVRCPAARGEIRFFWQVLRDASGARRRDRIDPGPGRLRPRDPHEVWGDFD